MYNIQQPLFLQLFQQQLTPQSIQCVVGRAWFSSYHITHCGSGTTKWRCNPKLPFKSCSANQLTRIIGCNYYTICIHSPLTIGRFHSFLSKPAYVMTRGYLWLYLSDPECLCCVIVCYRCVITTVSSSPFNFWTFKKLAKFCCFKCKKSWFCKENVN